MAKFKITPTTTVAELKEQFRNEVGCVLRVYQGRSEAPDGARSERGRIGMQNEPNSRQV